LPRVLEKVEVSVFDNLIFEHFRVRLKENERKWFALDGKELRGSIESGDKRGEVLVQAVAHWSGETAAQAYYCGKKESEKPSVRQVLKKGGLAGEKITLDALHCNEPTLCLIAGAGGKYLVGLKNNQKHLFNRVGKQMGETAVLYQSREVEKGHGRMEARRYEVYDILEMKRAVRWKNCQIRTAIKVTRERERLKDGKKSVETSYYVSNWVGGYEEIIEAIRRHWQVEVNNHIRDVTLKEDKMRSKKRMCSEQWRKSGH
jgi:predicted transposase YbfD/YdcC